MDGGSVGEDVIADIVAYRLWIVGSYAVALSDGFVDRKSNVHG